MIRSRYRALNTIMSLASGFTGILDKFPGAVAAYSTRKLTASQPNILPADHGDGAAAAYSLRKVKASYSGNCIDVRRSSDNTTSSIGFSGNELDTTALEAFVNASGNAYISDFRVIGDPPVDQEDMGETGGTGAGGQSIADVSDAYKFTQDGSTGIHRAGNPTNANIVGGDISISFEYYLPSGQTSNRILFITNDAGDAQVDLTTTDAWTTYSTTFSGIAGDQFWFYSAIIGQGLSFTGNGSDHFYLKNIVVTQTDADGFVTKWYDQSGNENDATQGTDNDQPQIVDAGSTILENGKPAIQFDGVNELVASGFSGSSIQDSYFVMNYQDDSVAMWMYDLYTNSADRYSPFVRNGESANPISSYGTPSYYVNSSAVTITTRTEAYNEFSNSKGQILRVDEGADTNTWQDISFGLWYPTYGYNGNAQEIIIFNSDQSDNRQDIEWNINNHYNIYTDSWDKQSAMQVRRAIDNETTNIGFVGKDLDTTALETFATESSPVLDDYTGAAAAYSLRKVRTAYTGSAIKVRRSSDNALQDIGFDANGDLDSTSLTTFVNSGEVFTNPDITSATGWTLGSSTTYNASTEAFDLVSENGLTVRQGKNVSGHTFAITIVLDSVTSGGIKIYAGGTQSAVISTAGTHTLNIVGGSSNDFFGINPNGTVTCSISSFSAIDTTADGAVTTWYDQSVPTETYDSDFSAGVDGFSATNQSNNTVTRLASVTDDYSTTVENVLQFEAATAGTNITQQLRNNLGLTIGGTYKVSFKMLIDSENETLVKAGLYDGAGSTPEDIVFGGKLTETGRWTTFTDVPITQENQRLFFAGLDSSDNFSFDSTVGDKFYIADVSVDEVNDATQTTADNQPLVVSGGTPVTENGKAAVEFDGSDDYFDTNLGTLTESSVFMLFRKTVNGSNGVFGGSGNRCLGYVRETSRHRIFYINWGAENITDSRTPPFTELVSFFRSETATTVDLFRDGVNKASLTSLGNTVINPTNLIGKLGGLNSYYFEGLMQELIFFDSADQSSNRTGIEGNIGRYYNIDGFRDVFVSKWYDQSGNFNHAENSTESEQPLVVSGGTLVTETNGLPAISWESNDLALFRIPWNSTSSQSWFGVFNPLNDSYIAISEIPAGGNRDWVVQNGSVSTGLQGFDNNPDLYINSDLQSPTTRDDLHTAFSTQGNVLASTIDLNINTWDDGSQWYFFGNGGGVSNLFNYSGRVQEWIVFESDQSTNREDIENNINKHFKIYEE